MLNAKGFRTRLPDLPNLMLVGTFWTGSFSPASAQEWGEDHRWVNDNGTVWAYQSRAAQRQAKWGIDFIGEWSAEDVDLVRNGVALAQRHLFTDASIGLADDGAVLVTQQAIEETREEPTYVFATQAEALGLGKWHTAAGKRGYDVFIEVESYRERNASWGRALVFYDRAAVIVDANGRVALSTTFRISLNVLHMDTSRDPAVWAGVIAHEMLHNLGHAHPDPRVDPNAYSSFYQINLLSEHVITEAARELYGHSGTEFVLAVATTSIYVPRMGGQVEACAVTPR